MDENTSKLVNSEQETYWNSPAGRKWIEFQQEMDGFLSRLSDRLFDGARIESGEKILDVGCGTGATTIDIAERVGPSGVVVGADISDLLLSFAKTRLEDNRGGRVQFLKADVQEYDFEEGSFDAMVSRFGTMFFSDSVAAFRNIAHALRSGGRVYFVSWTPIEGNPWFAIPRDAAVARLGKPAPAPPNAPGPLAFDNADRVLKILEDAGFTECSVTTEILDLLFDGPPSEAAALAGSLGVAVRIMRELNGTPEDAEVIRVQIEKEFRKFETEEGTVIPASLHFFSARKA